MKKSGMAFILVAALAATAAFAQQPSTSAVEISRTNLIVKKEVPTESDMYCSGFISPQKLADNSYIAAAWESPHQTRFADRDYVYLTGGNYEVGGKYHILRGVRNSNRYQFYKGQFALINKTGTPYAEMGRVRVIDVQKGIGIATVEFSCDGFIAGDIALPWTEKAVPEFRRDVPFERWAQPNGKLIGRIVMAKDFDIITSPKNKLYLNVGSNQGVKPGDYFRATRTHESMVRDQHDSLSVKASVVDSDVLPQPKFPKSRMGELPRRSIGEMIVLHVTPSTSTAMLTRALEAVEVGDLVELMDELPPLPPPPAPVMNPPTVTCVASPATIRVGETSNLRCTGVSLDDRPLTYSHNVDTGSLAPRGETATFDARNARPGLVNVGTTVTDDRNLSGDTVTRINVERAAVAEASKIADLLFRANSAIVDNAAKAILDAVALRMQREANSSVLLIGFSAESEAGRLGITRANNAKTYLTQDKGIDASRVQTADGGKGTRKVEVWFVPAGAAMPVVRQVMPAAKPAAKSAVTKKN